MVTRAMRDIRSATRASQSEEPRAMTRLRLKSQDAEDVACD